MSYSSADVEMAEPKIWNEPSACLQKKEDKFCAFGFSIIENHFKRFLNSLLQRIEKKTFFIHPCRI